MRFSATFIDVILVYYHFVNNIYILILQYINPDLLSIQHLYKKQNFISLDPISVRPLNNVFYIYTYMYTCDHDQYFY